MGRRERRLREKQERQEKAKQISSLSSHVKTGNDLVPQLISSANLKFSSWMNTRMPEMLWAVLAISTLERIEALEFFRSFTNNLYKIPKEKRAKDLFLTDLADIDAEDLERALVGSFRDVPRAAKALSPLLLFPELPGRKVWEKVLPSADAESAMELVAAVSRNLGHQSQEATDCRWIRIAYQVICERLLFSEETAHHIKEILEYPNYGDMRMVRPAIRASEISISQMKAITDSSTEDTAWISHFWEVGFEATPCITSDREIITEGVDPSQVFADLSRIQEEVSQGFIDTATMTSVDARHDSAFGLLLYAIETAKEVSQPIIHNGVLGRLGLRTIVEIYITLSYLIRVDDPAKWLAYRNYGSGQAKLAFLKLLDAERIPDFVDMEALEELANEDMWQEFVTIKLGNWNASNLRKMSEQADSKPIYDSYYDITSGYVHGQWSTVRDTTMTNCLNPLHRLHRVPKVHHNDKISVLDDVTELIQRMVDKVKGIYPF